MKASFVVRKFVASIGDPSRRRRPPSPTIASQMKSLFRLLIVRFMYSFSQIQKDGKFDNWEKTAEKEERMKRVGIERVMWLWLAI